MARFACAFQFLPHLLTRPTAAIVNVSSGLAFVPTPNFPRLLRIQGRFAFIHAVVADSIEKYPSRVFELAPPLTHTALFKGDLSPRDVAGVTPWMSNDWSEARLRVSRTVVGKFGQD